MTRYIQYSMILLILNSYISMIFHVWNLLFKFRDIPGFHCEYEPLLDYICANHRENTLCYLIGR